MLLNKEKNIYCNNITVMTALVNITALVKWSWSMRTIGDKINKNRYWNVNKNIHVLHVLKYIYMFNMHITLNKATRTVSASIPTNNPMMLEWQWLYNTEIHVHKWKFIFQQQKMEKSSHFTKPLSDFWLDHVLKYTCMRHPFTSEL